jgi:acyl carrier protein
LKVKEWIIKWFEKNSDLKLDEINKFQHDDYLAKSWIDSFKFIRMITEIEEKYKITFSNKEFQEKKFATIDGLSKIIESRIKNEI